MAHLTWLKAVVVGGLQGVAELFRVSSLGHSILISALVGRSWARDLDASAPEPPYLAFVVGLHVATALAPARRDTPGRLMELTGAVGGVLSRNSRHAAIPRQRVRNLAAPA